MRLDHVHPKPSYDPKVCYTPMPRTNLTSECRTTLIGLAVLCASLSANATTTAPAVEEVSSIWYADNSCRLRINGVAEVGITSIDADMDETGARTLIHCDSATGRRLTLMTRGNGLTIGERQELANVEEMDTAVDAALAWVTLIDQSANQDVPDEVMARRFVTHGQVIIRETPGVRTIDSAPHVDNQAFAEVSGTLEPLARHYERQEAMTDDKLGDVRVLGDTSRLAASGQTATR